MSNNTILPNVLTVTASAYSAGDCVGGLVDVACHRANKPSSLALESVVLVDLADQKADMVLWVLSGEPGESSVVEDSEAFALDAEDAPLVLGTISIGAADYADAGSYAVATIAGIGLPVEADAGSLYFALVTTGTPTYTAVDDLMLQIGLR